MAIPSPDPMAVDQLDRDVVDPSRPDAEPPASPERPTGMGRAPSDTTWWWLTGFVVAAGRWAFAADRTVFHVVPDEPAQLAMARWLSGGTRWNMFDHVTYRPGHALLLAPFVRLAGSGEALVRTVLTVNAVAAGVSAVLLAMLIDRWTTVGRRWAALIAIVTALAPSAISASAYTWAETSVTLTFLATLLAVQRLIDDRGWWPAMVAVTLAAAAMTVHGRSLPLLPTVAVLAAILLVTARKWNEAAGILALAAVLGLASLTFVGWVQDHVWDDPSSVNGAGSVVGQIDAPVALVDSAVGQTWYQLVATLGMVGIGIGVVLRSLLRPDDRLGRWQAWSLVALTAPLVLTSIAFMAGRDRPDQLVYGRYVDAVVWPYTALGLAWVVARARQRNGADPGRTMLPLVVGSVTILTGAVVALRHGDLLAADVGLRMMVPGLLPYVGSGDGVPVVRITVLAVGGLAVLAATGRRRIAPVAVVLAGLALAVAAVRVHDAQALRLNHWDIADDVAAIDELVPAGDAIGVVFDRRRATPDFTTQRQRAQVYQLYLPDHEFVVVSPSRATTRFVIGPRTSADLVLAGARVQWRDPEKPMALWEFVEP